MIGENKLIAEFMGGELVDQIYPGVYRYRNITPDSLILPRDLEYDTSWDWLMPVIKKIVNLPLKPKSVEHLIVPLRDALLNVRIEDTHHYVVEFIKWYNENSNQLKNE